MNRIFSTLGIVLCCMCLSVFLADFSTLGLPHPNGVGLEDKRSFGMLFLGIVLLVSLFKKVNLARATVLLLILVTALFCISNWWYFSFYRTFISVSDLKLGLSISESTKSLGAIGQPLNVTLLLAGCLALFFCYFLMLKKRQFFSMPIILCLAIASFGASYKYQQRAVEEGMVFPGVASHPVMHFIRSTQPVYGEEKVNENHVAAIKTVLNKPVNDDDFPLYDPRDSKGESAPYNVIVVLLESVRAAESGLYNEGLSMTPNLDAIARENNYVTKAYANSIQTVRGETSVFCSIFDLAQGAPFSSYDLPLQTNCLPKILKNNGYETSWFHGYKKEFFRRDTYLAEMGFTKVYDQDLITNLKPGLDIVGWGINDFAIFDFSLETLEQAKKPFLAEILTLSNHFPFEYDWGVEFSEDVTLASEQEREAGNTIYSNYLKGINYTDKAVGHFWEKFKQSELYDNTIVFFLADHGIWTFSEAQKKADVFAKNERYFRIPMVFYHPDLKANKIDTVASQVDVAPTILDMLDIEAPTAFLGESILDDERHDKVIMNKIGDYALAERDLLCVSETVSCDEFYQRCKVKKRIDELSCANYSGDILSESSIMHDVEQVDSEAVELVIDYSNKGLFYGFMPEDARL